MPALIEASASSSACAAAAMGQQPGKTQEQNTHSFWRSRRRILLDGATSRPVGTPCIRLGATTEQDPCIK